MEAERAADFMVQAVEPILKPVIGKFDPIHTICAETRPQEDDVLVHSASQ